MDRNTHLIRLELIRNLSAHSSGAHDVSDEMLQAYFPQLTPDEIVAVRTSAELTGDHTVATPGLFVQGAFHVLHAFTTDEDRPGTVSVRYAYAGRCPSGYTASYQEEQRRKCRSTLASHYSRAVNYASLRWHGWLVKDTAVDVLAGWTCYPTERPTLAYAVPLDRQMTVILADNTEPLHELIEDAIYCSPNGNPDSVSMLQPQTVFTNPLAVDELVGASLPYMALHCGVCGGEVSPQWSCRDCYVQVLPQVFSARMPLSFPLPRVVTSCVRDYPRLNTLRHVAAARLRAHHEWLLARQRELVGQQPSTLDDRNLRSIKLDP